MIGKFAWVPPFPIYYSGIPQKCKRKAGGSVRKRIEELAEGKIPYDQPQIVFSREKLELQVVEGHQLTDSFQIKSENEIPMKGIIYSSNSRMECLTPRFEGIKADVRFRFDPAGLVEGEISTGEFYVVLNGGEYQLSYAVTVGRLYAEASTGKIRNMKEFTDLAKAEYKEAWQIFRSPAFVNVIGQRNLKAQLLYKSLTSQSVTEQTMDEFLIGTGRKERVKFFLEKHSAEYFEVDRPMQEQIHIDKAGWGYLQIRVTSNAGFLVPQKRFLTNGDFIGNGCMFDFYIDAGKMHAGNNFGTICFENDVQKEEFQVWASADCIDVRRERKLQVLQRASLELTQCYVDYRLRKIVTGEWTKQTAAVLDTLEGLDEGNVWYPLWRAYTLLSNRQKQDAEWVLNAFRQRYKNKKTPQWAFYDYLCLQNEKEPVVVDRLLAEIEDIAKRYAGHPMIFFLTLRLNGALRSQPQIRLRALEDRIMGGQYTPVWYVEAFRLYKEEPYFLTKLGKFEILLMNWASRQGVMTRDLSDQVMRLANNMRKFDPVVCRTLFRCYDAFPDEDMLAGVCAYLIKGQCFRQKYHAWYEKGIEENLKITGLYEAYLLTMDLHSVQPLPKVIQMYFQYNNQLSYEYKAALYVNIIAHKEEQPQIYEKYMMTIKQFAIDEILKGHIDENLAVIYDEMLDKGILTQELAAPLADILYTHRLFSMNRMAACVIVVQKHINGEQRVPLVGGSAYFQLYSNDYAIVLEGKYGQRFVAPDSCQLEKLMKPSHYIRRCLGHAPDRLPYLIHHMDGKADLMLPQESDVDYLCRLMEAPQISASFKNQIGPGLVRYCLMNHKDEHIEEYFGQIDFSGFSRENRNTLIELLISRNWMERAYELVNAYGYAGINRQLLGQMAAYIIRVRDIGEDAFFLELCLAVLTAGVQGRQVTGYLVKYYEGPSKQMMHVYKAAKELELDGLEELEERLLVQSLYSTEYVDEIQEVYQGYRSHGGREFILQAYRSYCMHEYVVHEMVLPNSLFIEACQLQKEGRLKGIACRLGLLKYFSELERLDRYQLREADELLNEFTSRNMNFAFYKNLPRELCGRYQLYSRALVEYHARPDARIQIHYRMPGSGDDFVTANMPNVYDGIFTWEFLLFSDDEVEYYITEDAENGAQQLGESRRIGGIEYRDIKYGGRYAYINDMLCRRTQTDGSGVMRLMQDFKKLDIVTEKVFKII